MNKTSDANQAVITIRLIKAQIKKADYVSTSAYKKTIIPFVEKISTIEETLYQVKNQSGQDPLNFPIKLNNRLASLRRSVENGDAKPTDGAYEVFEELSIELDKNLGQLKNLLETEVPTINKLLKKPLEFK